MRPAKFAVFDRNWNDHDRHSQVVVQWQADSGSVNTLTTLGVSYNYLNSSGGANSSRLVSEMYPKMINGTFLFYRERSDNAEHDSLRGHAVGVERADEWCRYE